jgi:hypothetical protein
MEKQSQVELDNVGEVEAQHSYEYNEYSGKGYAPKRQLSEE